MKRRVERMQSRPAVKRACEAGKPCQSNRQNTDPKSRKILFGQSAARVRGMV
jgi:hypothetical protein